MKNALVTLLMLCLSVSGFAQSGNVAKILNQMSKRAAGEMTNMAKTRVQHATEQAKRAAGRAGKMTNMVNRTQKMAEQAAKVVAQAQQSNVTNQAKKAAELEQTKQAPKDPAQKAPESRNVSSKNLARELGLNENAIKILTSVQNQQIAAILTSDQIPDAQRAQVLEITNKKNAALAENLHKLRNKLHAQWAEALLRERNPKFLPKKDRSIPGLLAFSPDPAKHAHMTPRFFREWLTTVPTSVQGAPDELGGLLFALTKKLHTLDLATTQAVRSYMRAKVRLEPGNEVVNRPLRRQMREANRELLKISKESAQAMSDLVDLMNLYPNTFGNWLQSLAYTLDNSMQTEFIKYLRAKIKVDVKQNIQNRRRIGFTESSEPVDTRLQGKTFEGLPVK